jgi:hypothetical protein
MLILMDDGDNGMKWLETIKVQSASSMERITERQLLRPANEIKNSPDHRGWVEVKVYKHSSVPGYFAIRFNWSSGPPPVQGSPLGMRITQTLKSFGVVDHSVWIEEEKKGEWV